MAFYERQESVGQRASCWETGHYQRLLDQRTASHNADVACQEAVCAAHKQDVPRQESALASQRLHAECVRATRERYLAAHRQRLQCEVMTHKIAAARRIFLWLRRRRILAQLACMTVQRQQHQTALARLQHEQECCGRALQAEKHRKIAAAVHAQTIADETNHRHQQAKVVIDHTRHHAMAIGNTQQTAATISNAQQHATTARGTQHHTATIVDTQQHAATLAVAQRRHKTAVQAAASAELTLANKHCRLGTATAMTMSVKSGVSLRQQRRCRWSAH